MGKYVATQKELKVHAGKVHPRVSAAVMGGLLGEAKRAKVSVDTVAAQILAWWWEDVVRERELAAQKTMAALGGHLVGKT